MVTGVAGTGADSDRNKGAEKVWAKNPGIKVVARYTGMWDSATAAAQHRGACCPRCRRSTASGARAAPTA